MKNVMKLKIRTNFWNTPLTSSLIKSRDVSMPEMFLGYFLGPVGGMLSNGIYQAMVTTVGGLIVGIIALFAYNYLVAKVDGVVNQIEQKSLAFMDLLNE